MIIATLLLMAAQPPDTIADEAARYRKLCRESVEASMTDKSGKAGTDYLNRVLVERLASREEIMTTYAACSIYIAGFDHASEILLREEATK